MVLKYIKNVIEKNSFNNQLTDYFKIDEDNDYDKTIDQDKNFDNNLKNYFDIKYDTDYDISNINEDNNLDEDDKLSLTNYFSTLNDLDK